MEIVSLPVEDWQAYRALRLRALKEDPLAFGSSFAGALELPEERWKARLAAALQGEGSWLLFAREQGRLVGMIGAFVDVASPDMATIISVYVPAEDRGKGISTRLMETILCELSKAPYLKRAALSVNATQQAAIGLYRRFGFEPKGSEPAMTGNGLPVEQILMERALPY